MKPSDFLTELSNDKLTQYKTAAAADASKADKEGDFKKGDKRFSGIVKATKKQFDNDAKKDVEEGWKDVVAGGAMALGAAGANADTRRVTPDGQGGFTGGLKPSATVVAPDNTPPATKPTAPSDTSHVLSGC